MTREVLDRNGDPQDGNEEFAYAHEDRAPEEQRPAPEAIDRPHSGERHAHINDVDGDRDEERVLDPGTSEECDSI